MFPLFQRRHLLMYRHPWDRNYPVPYPPASGSSLFSDESSSGLTGWVIEISGRSPLDHIIFDDVIPVGMNLVQFRLPRSALLLFLPLAFCSDR